MLQPGEVLHGAYRIERIIGVGGMGRVYLATQESLGRPVAIKEMEIDVVEAADRAAAIQQFHREAATLASSEHPNLVDVKEFFQENDAGYLVMTFIDGVTLEQVCRNAPSLLAPALVLEWMVAVCDVLEFLHGRVPPIIVRDLKPSNIMIDVAGRLRLIDFGIARVVRDGSHTATYLRGLGTIGYAPLEQYGDGSAGIGGTDARSDVYSLGATAYALLTRTHPPWSVSRATGDETLRPPSAVNPAVSPALDAVVMKMMELTRQARYASAAEASKALRSALGTVAAVPPMPLRQFCSKCGLPVVPLHTSCHHCNEPFADTRALTPFLVAPASEAIAAVIDGAPVPNAYGTPSPPMLSAGPIAAASPVAEHVLSPTIPAPVVPTPRPSDTRPKSATLWVLVALVAGGLIYAAVSGLSARAPGAVSAVAVASPSPSPVRVAATSPAASASVEAMAPLAPTPEPPIVPVETPTPAALETPVPATLDKPSYSMTPMTPVLRKSIPSGSGYLNAESNRRLLTVFDLRGHDARYLCLMRNEIYARHGRPFLNPAIRAWFKSRTWYHVNPHFRDASLTPLERRNALFIQVYQNYTHQIWPP